MPWIAWLRLIANISDIYRSFSIEMTRIRGQASEMGDIITSPFWVVVFLVAIQLTANTSVWFLVPVAHLALLMLLWRKRRSLTEYLFLVMAISIPVSFVNMTGVNGDLPRHSLFYVVVVGTFVYFGISLRKRPYVSAKLQDLLILMFGTASVLAIAHAALLSPDIDHALQSTLAILPMFLPVAIVSLRRQMSEAVHLKKLLYVYILGGVATALFLVIQLFLVLSGGDSSATVFERVGRISFGGAWYDFSLLSVYLATSLVALVFLGGKGDRESTPGGARSHYLYLTILFAGLVLTGARAGIVAIGLVAPLVAVLSLLQRKISTRRAFVMGGVALIGSVVLLTVVRTSLSSPSSFLGDAIRMETWSFWLERYLSGGLGNIIMGVALGSENHSLLAGGVHLAPHNVVIATLLNGGLVFGLYVLTMSVVIVLNGGYQEPALMVAFVVGVVGGMVAPSAVVSRFLPFLYILGTLAASSDPVGRQPSRPD